MKRYLENQILHDLSKKMVFLGGPRQAGKTTLAKKILGSKKIGYMNWDRDEDRLNILERKLPKTNLWVFDEIHKYKKWRNFIKGLFDSFGKTKKILVTGSAKLDFYRYGGDSLQGRYHYLRLHPLSVAELKIKKIKDLEQLLRLGGFPEPFLSGSEVEARRWSREYRSRLIREEMTKVEQVQDLDKVELLSIRLPDLVGSPLSLNSLREDLEVSHKTVSKWVQILERLFHVFRVTPFDSPKIKSIKKESKHYHFNWSLPKDDGAKFENMIASHLLKWCHYIEDTEGFDMELRYFRDIDGREVDFVVLKDRLPQMFVECKLQDMSISPALKYLKKKFTHIPAFQVLYNPEYEFVEATGIEVISALNFLNKLI